MATSKPDLTTNGIWGSDNINITDPGATKTKEGWGSEIPPSGVQNWWQERADEMLNHLNEQGIAVWDSLTDYPVNGWVKGSDGEVYISLQTPNLNQDPTSTPAYWQLLVDFFSVPDASETVKGKIEISNSVEAAALTAPDKAIVPNVFGDAFRSILGGIGNDSTLTSETIDADTIGTTSFRYLSLSSPNIPSPNTYYVRTIVLNSDNAMQIAQRNNSTSPWSFVRSKQAGTWGDWEKIGTSSNELCARAFVNFDGQTGSIIDAYNVSSVTRTATGKYTLTFPAGAIPSTNYCVIFGVRGRSSNTIANVLQVRNNGTKNTTTLQIDCDAAATYAAEDCQQGYVLIFDN